MAKCAQTEPMKISVLQAGMRPVFGRQLVQRQTLTAYRGVGALILKSKLLQMMVPWRAL